MSTVTLTIFCLSKVFIYVSFNIIWEWSKNSTT